MVNVTSHKRSGDLASGRGRHTVLPPLAGHTGNASSADPFVVINSELVLVLVRRADLTVDTGPHHVYKFSKPQPVTADAIAAGITAMGQRLEQLLAEQPIPRRAAVPDAVPAPAASPATLAGNAAWMAHFKTSEMEIRVQHMNEGRLVKAPDLAALLGISKQAVSKAEREGRMFSVLGPSNVKLYPAFYADPHLNRAQLAQVTRALGEKIPGPSKWMFFTTFKTSLDVQTPIDALAAGRFDDVMRAAVGEAER